MGRTIVVVVAAALLVASCAGTDETSPSVPASPPDADPIEASTTVSASPAIEDYPDAKTRALATRAAAQRPVENSALPPRHLEPERHPETLVDRNRIVSGGPPPDGIASIDSPIFVAAAAVDWLDDDEPVAVVTVAGPNGTESRIYPAQILVWHEIVNDTIAGVPVTVTYCPLCNSAVAVERTIAGPDRSPLVLDFGTSGALYASALVMYDRQTESLWTHFDGRAVVGDLLGEELTIVPAAIVSWADARDGHPTAPVLDRPTGADARAYGTTPYPSYETAPPSAGFITDEGDGRLEPKQRVVGIEIGRHRLAIDRRRLVDDRLVTAEVGEVDLVVLWQPGTTSALDGKAIAEGLRVGAVGVFRPVLDGRPVTLEAAGVGFRDRETGSSWTVLGQATAGPLAGSTLEPVPHLDTFWFAWSRYHPDTDLVS